VVFGAGVVQISSVIDTQLASLLPSGSVAALRFAQLIAILPVSLFGVGVAAVALPELSRDAVGESHDALKTRLAEGLRQLAFFVIPSAFAFAAIGSAMVGALFETGSFDSRDTSLVAGVLAAYAIAVPAQASIKLLASGHYALGDTKTPVRIAILAVVVSATSAFVLMQSFGPAGIALGAAIGAYLNVLLNSIKLRGRLGSFLARGDVRSFLVSAFSAVLAAIAGGEVAALLSQRHVWIEASCSMFVFAAVYGVSTLVMRHPEAKRIVQSMRRRGRQ
jgi:putative peptidoglycan lipid II flippase